MRMNILEAYCLELGYTLDIYAAQRAYFAQPEGQRQRFHFLCSEDTCRAQNVIVAGVNYHRLADESNKFRQMHFKAIHTSPHDPSCRWNMATEEPGAPPPSEEDVRIKIPRAKETDVIDVFSPRTSDQVAKTPGGQSGPASRPPLDDPERNRDDRDQNFNREGQSRTSLLEKFIDCWRNIEGEALKEHYVTILGQRLSYRQAVTQVQWVRPEDSGKRIVYGGARVSLWPNEKPTKVYINFIDHCENVEPYNGSKTLVIDLPLNRIERHHSAGLLLAKIKESCAPKRYVQVFAWGTIEPHHRSGYQIKLESLDNLVLKVRESGAKDNARTTNS